MQILNVLAAPTSRLTGANPIELEIEALLSLAEERTQFTAISG